MRFKQIIREYFTFSRTEKRGLWLLGVMLLIVSAIPISYRHLLAPEPTPPVIHSVSTHQTAPPEDSKPNYRFIEFDPNKVSAEKLEEMGINKYVIGNWMKYRKAGGQFYNRDDVLAIYGMDKETYLTLRKYVKIPRPDYGNSDWEARKPITDPIDVNSASADELMRLRGIGPVFGERIVKYRDAMGGFDSIAQLKKVYGLEAEVVDDLSDQLYVGSKPERPRKSKGKWDSLDRVKYEAPRVMIELNSADSLELTSLRGIGPVYANRIMTFRNALGGFYKKEQLLEVYGLPPETFEQLQDQLEVAPDGIETLNINEASSAELEAHPYISRPLSNFIVSYRMNHNGFTELSELKQSFLVDEALFRKLAPYLSLEAE